MTEDGKKILFIEGIQSDLHQQGSMKGYFSKSFTVKLNQMREDARAAYDEVRRLKSDKIKINDEMWMLQNSGDLSSEIDAGIKQYEQMLEENAELTKNAISLHEGLLRDIGNANQRQQIPNAPFKSNWEDYVIRRMIRHAVEHGYDGIAWHGSLESVAATEGYGELEELKDERGKNQYIVYGSTSVTPIVNRYLVKLPRIVRGVADPFGVTLDHELGQGPLPEPWELGLNEPDLTAFSDPEALYDFANVLIKDHKNNILDDLYRSDEDRGMAEHLVNMLKAAKQITRQRRVFDPDDILQAAGFDSDGIKHIHAWHANLDYYAGADAAIDGAPRKGGIPYDNYRLIFNQAMTESFVRGDQPFFSMVEARASEIEANPKFQEWFKGSVVTDDENATDGPLPRHQFRSRTSDASTDCHISAPERPQRIGLIRKTCRLPSMATASWSD